jgi:hypothetical protein
MRRTNAMHHSDQLRNQAAELRRLVPMTVDQSDAFVHLLRAEAKADDLAARGSPAGPWSARSSAHDCNAQ